VLRLPQDLTYNEIETMSMQNEIIAYLKNQGADIVRFVDISKLHNKQNQGYPTAILIGIVLSSEFIQKMTNIPDYLEQINCKKEVKEDEFHMAETKTDKLADDMATCLSSKGYSAYSQSENHIYSTGFYDEKTKSTALPHKTIAGLAGLGWIGKHNLLVTAEFGSAISLCTVLTDAPLKTVLHTPAKSHCGNCNVCETICSVKAIKGKPWKIGVSRNELIDVCKCSTCLKCLAVCPWTQNYMKKNKTTMNQHDIINDSIKDYSFLKAMYQDTYFPNLLVDKGKHILLELCSQIESKKPENLDSLYKLTQAATDKFNELEEEFEDNDSEIETAARECIAMDLEFIAKAYSFEEADIEELIATRDW